MRAADLMARRVVSVEPGTSIFEAAQRMLEDDVDGLPVVDRENRLVGIVTEGDLLRRTETGTEYHHPGWQELLIPSGRLAHQYVRTHGRLVSDVMTADVVTVSESTPIELIAELMERRRIKQIPVVSHDRVIGIARRKDLVRALLAAGAEPRAPAGSDAEIRDALLRELQAQSWAALPALALTVRDGVVEFWGATLDPSQRRGVRVAAETVAGVREVRDHPTWLD